MPFNESTSASNPGLKRAMLFTALSYGRMANAGSAYTYVSREIHPAARVPGRLGDDLRLRHEPAI